MDYHLLKLPVTETHVNDKKFLMAVSVPLDFLVNDREPDFQVEGTAVVCYGRSHGLTPIGPVKVLQFLRIRTGETVPDTAPFKGTIVKSDAGATSNQVWHIYGPFTK